MKVKQNNTRSLDVFPNHAAFQGERLASWRRPKAHGRGVTFRMRDKLIIGITYTLITYTLLRIEAPFG